ncbi:solute carrier family 23 member 3 isoform X3 [Columba livia]|uniref:solute carrier family 23 member 3 isoform X3 n=1 Tax=Columba livia TaxID=8932 RepID=UPI0031BA19BF
MNGGHHRAPGARSPALASCSLQNMCSWLLSCCLALQHLAVQASLLCIFHLFLLPTLPEEPPHVQATSELLARSFFACGISTVLQTTLGSRLPLVQIPSFEYLVPAMVLSSHLSLGAGTDRNGEHSHGACIPQSLGLAGARGTGMSRCPAHRARLWPAPALHHTAPLQGAGLPRCKRLMLLAVIFSQHLGSCRLPFCAWPQAQGGPTEPSTPTPRTFSVLLPFAGVCIVCAVLSHLHVPWESLDPATAQLSWANSTSNAPWLHIPYAGEWGWPLLTTRALAAGIAMAISCSMNSVGCYVLCGKLLRAPRLPPHACNRGLCMEGLGSLLAGLLGTPGGTAASIANTCAAGLTQMEGSEELESSLLTQPWASVCFGESAFLAKACFRDTGYTLLISDLSSVWYESADAETVGQRSKELNKRLTVHVSSFLHRLRNLMCPLLTGQPDAATSFSCHRAASGLSLHVKSELSGLPFYWDFHCCLAPVEMVSRHLVRPLIQMSLVLQYQVQELTSLLLQKDAEIEDYRESGAALSRDRLQTKPFQEEMFQQNFMAETLPQICSVGGGQAFPSALQQLYMAVTQQEAKQARKRQRSGDAEGPAPTAETAGHPQLPPPSQEDETASSSEGITCPPQLRSPVFLQPRPSQRKRRGSSAEMSLPPALRVCACSSI